MSWILRISPSVEGATLSPEMASSPWILPVSPAGVVVRQAQDEGSDAADGGASAGSFGASCAGVAAAQQVTVPAQDGVGGDDQTELSQGGSGDLVEQNSEERPVGRGEPWFIDSTLQDGELVA
jgi:hypothetical protein